MHTARHGAELLSTAADKLEVHATDLIRALRAASYVLTADPGAVGSPQMHTVHLLVAAIFADLFVFFNDLPDAALDPPYAPTMPSPRFSRIQAILATLSLLGLEELDPSPDASAPTATVLLAQAREHFDALERLLDPTPKS